MTHPPIDSPTTFPDWPFPWPAFDVDWRDAALLLIDLQNYSANPDAGLMQLLAQRRPDVAAYYVPWMRDVVVPNAARLLAAFRAAGRPVLYTRHGSLLPDGSDMAPRRRRRAADAAEGRGLPAMWPRGTFEHEIIAELQPQPNELVLDKNTSSAFHSTPINYLLGNLGIETIVIAGMATDMCVEMTARDAGDLGYNVIVVEDATATFYPQHHSAALSGLARVFAQVWTTGQVLASLSW